MQQQDPDFLAWKAERDALKRRYYRPWMWASLASVGVGLILVLVARNLTAGRDMVGNTAVAFCFLGALCSVVGGRIWRRKLLALHRTRPPEQR